jgi:hypothetical protein
VSSVPVKPNRAEPLLLGSAGTWVSWVSGDVVSSTVHSYSAGDGSTLPPESVARTKNMWSPPKRPVYVFGDVHAV